jgi:hypothetical protein
MSIAMSFDQMGTVANRLRDAGESVAEISADIPTDAGTYGSEVLASAAAAYALAVDRLQRELSEQVLRVADGVADARADMETYEQGVLDALGTTETPGA